MSNTVPPAIEAIAAEEEQWRMIHFVDKPRNRAIVDVGRLALDEDPYYVKILKGTSDIEDILKLEEIEPTAVQRRTALEKRRQKDAQWRRRPQLAWLAAKLWRQGFFDDSSESGALFGYQECGTDEHPDMCRTVWVEPDGEIRIRIDDPPTVFGGMRLEWHEYKLPRETYLVEHEFQPVGGVRQRTLAIDSRTIVNQVKTGLEIIHENLTATAA